MSKSYETARDAKAKAWAMPYDVGLDGSFTATFKFGADWSRDYHAAEIAELKAKLEIAVERLEWVFEGLEHIDDIDYMQAEYLRKGIKKELEKIKDQP